MLELSRRPPGLHIKQIWFAEQPYDVVDCDEVHFYHCKKDIRMEGFSQQRACTIVIDLSKGEERVWGNINRNNRVSVRKAKDAGIIVHRNQNISEFLTMDKEFRASKGLIPVNYPIDFLHKNCLVLTAEADGELIAGLLSLVDDSNMLVLLAASRRLEVDKEKSGSVSIANKTLWWEAIRYGLENGVIDFDMGGYDDMADENDPIKGVNKFKISFGGDIVHYYNYAKAYSTRVKVARRGLRSIGRLRNFFYARKW